MGENEMVVFGSGNMKSPDGRGAPLPGSIIVLVIAIAADTAAATACKR